MSDHQDNADDLAAVKQVLHHFARARSTASRGELEREFGEVLLYLLKLAGRMNVDVVSVCRKELEQLAADSNKPDGSPSGRGDTEV